MSNPLSPTLTNIFMCKLEKDVVTPRNPPLYDRYVDDCFTKRMDNTSDILFENLNNYHPNIKFTFEGHPKHFLDTSFDYKEGKFSTKVYKKPGKLQVHWISATPEKWKCNTIIGTLHGAKQIATNWDEEVKAIKESFIKVGHPIKIINEVIQEIQIPKIDETIIPVSWFGWESESRH